MITSSSVKSAVLTAFPASAVRQHARDFSTSIILLSTSSSNLRAFSASKQGASFNKQLGQKKKGALIIYLASTGTELVALGVFSLFNLEEKSHFSFVIAVLFERTLPSHNA